MDVAANYLSSVTSYKLRTNNKKLSRTLLSDTPPGTSVTDLASIVLEMGQYIESIVSVSVSVSYRRFKRVISLFSQLLTWVTLQCKRKRVRQPHCDAVMDGFGQLRSMSRPTQTGTGGAVKIMQCRRNFDTYQRM